MLRYLDSFSRVGNVIVLHNLTSWKGVSYPSKVFPVVEDTNPILLNFFLDEAGKRGCGVLFSYHWVPETDLDMWRYPAEKQIASAKKVIKELYETYSAYDAMAGFYSYWELGDIRESTYFQQTLDFVKKLDEGLFTASAPYIFSTETYHGGSLPLMPSALSSIKSLDCIVPQSSVAVYPYPLGRTKDHAMLAAGSSAALGKVVLGHIETFERSFVKGE